MQMPSQPVFIPFRNIRYRIPVSLLLEVLVILLSNEVRYIIECISDDKSHIQILVSINLNKRYQSDPVLAIELLLDTHTKRFSSIW